MLMPLATTPRTSAIFGSSLVSNLNNSELTTRLILAEPTVSLNFGEAPRAQRLQNGERIELSSVSSRSSDDDILKTVETRSEELFLNYFKEQ